jgi:hypothetical protein
MSNMIEASSDKASQIDALTTAAEFLMGSVRALARGYEVDSVEVRRSVEWALSKVREATGQ